MSATLVPFVAGVPVAKDRGYLGAHLPSGVIPPGMLWPSVCTQKEVAGKPWCNTQLPDRDRAASFVAALVLGSKLSRERMPSS